MKTQIFRVMTLGLAASSLALGAGREEMKAPAEETLLSTNSNPGKVVVPAPTPSEPKPTAKDTSASDATSAGTNAPVPGSPKLVLPENLKLSAALGEVVKLAQAGVSEDVLLTYVISSTNMFHVGADEIVYLNDLGVPSTVITTLIQHDVSPEILARKQAAESVKHLPPEQALTTPATNVYPTRSVPPLSNNYSAVAMPEPIYVTPPATSDTDASTSPSTAADYFYSALSPYGIWVDVQDYGRCWQPTVAIVDSYWRPYADGGRWYWTDSGWYWHSYYSWGWAPFHYGRWYNHPGTGWVWVPDTCWGPAWVTWRYTPYYCGWAALPPRCSYVNGFGLYYNNSSVSVGFGFGFGYDQYTWIPNAFFCDPYPHHYFVASGQAKPIFNQSTPINNVTMHNGTIFNHGFGLDRISRVSRSEIRKVTVREEPMPRPGAARFERFQNENGAPVLVRPRLPQGAPPVPATTPNRAGTQNRNPMPPSPRRVSPEPDRQATALLPAATRNMAMESAPTAPSAAPAPAVPAAPSGSSGRPNQQRAPIIMQGPRNVTDNSGSGQGSRPPQASQPQPGRSGLPGTATMAAPASPATPRPSTTQMTPSVTTSPARLGAPPMPLAKNEPVTIQPGPSSSLPPAPRASGSATLPAGRFAAPAAATPSAPVPRFEGAPRAQFVPAPTPSAPTMRSEAPRPTPRMEAPQSPAPSRAASAPSSPPPASRSTAAGPQNKKNDR